jgi:hypothetical protein
MWLVAWLMLGPSSTRADESAMQLRLGIAPAGLIYSEKVTERPLFSPRPPSSTYNDGGAFGGQAQFSVSWRPDERFDLGGLLRVAVFPAATARVDNQVSTFRFASVGPQIGVRFARVYARADVGFGHLQRGTFGAKGVGAGAELGLTHPLSPTIDGQLGVGAAALVGWQDDHGDANDYEYRRTALTLTLVLAFVFRQ